ncbi:hypothetical protein N7495_003815 [Penicillium taxi]|uniref:uncharacterized protein n=1 Tax=Penicillium taxi TaxID=168475 RepID=UPI002544E396|nr:uncharacterized protein N7495_003815 [Penicillium taxi]KAJ5899071.1 hypothetical protein N7495_003815 [Penicillium taxi]
MVAEKLTIRNNTDKPFILKRIERFEKHKSVTSLTQNITNITSNFTRILSNSTRTNESLAVITEDSRPVEDQNDIDLRIEPFAIQRTEIRAFKSSDTERMRITFKVEGEEHQVQVPVPTTESATMKALTANPMSNFTGIYITPESYLTIFSSAHLNSWMGELRDDTLLSALSIPGTHNSPTCHIAAPSVRCQAVSPREQLKNGVRFFDIRVQPVYPDDAAKDEMALVHSVFSVSLSGSKYFRDLVHDIQEFLDQNPSETLIMSVKREGTGNATDEQLSRILAQHYANDRWWVRPKIPTLGEARGKVVLIRRFGLNEALQKEHGGTGWGIDAASWEDNTPNATCPSGEICIQDFYEVQESTNIEKKIGFVRDHIDLACRAHYPFGVQANAQETKKYPFYINFLSASNFWSPNTWPEKIAAKVNPAAVEYICRRHRDDDGDCSTGILVTDWVGLNGDWDLVRCIVGMNAKLRMRELASA